jgi:hypothetical protein
MSHVYNLETEIIDEIERLEREAQRIRERARRAHREDDQRTLGRQADEIREHIRCLLPNLS